MKARQIIFQGSMVRALIDGRKMQTRRVVKGGYLQEVRDSLHSPEVNDYGRWFLRDDTTGGYVALDRCPYGAPGDLLYVREAFYCDIVPYNVGGGLPNPPTPMIKDNLYYRADGTCCDQIPECECAEIGKPSWRSPIHMPRWASRLTLQLTDVRVERVQEISEADAEAEGCRVVSFPNVDHLHSDRDRFRCLWNRIHGYGAWDRNDWVWALTFRVIHANVDDVLAEPGRYLEAA